MPFALDVDKAKALLAEAGYADGFEIGIVVREAQERTPSQRSSLLMSQMLRDVDS